MDQSDSAPSAPADSMSQAQELVQRISELLAADEFQQALDLFNTLHPADQATLLSEQGDEEQQRLLEAIAPESSARILSHLEPEDAVEVLSEVEAADLSDILDEARPEVAADILESLPEEQSRETLEGMEEAKDVIPLLDYPEESAGGVMTPEYLSVREDMTADMALDTLRILGPDAERVTSIFIVDPAGRLRGLLSITRLALARGSSLVQDLMDPNVISVTSQTDQEECARLMERYDLSYLPVQDMESRLVGVILIDDVVDVLEEEATEDMYKIAGIGRERVFGPLRSSVRRRVPWLYLNLATHLDCRRRHSPLRIYYRRNGDSRRISPGDRRSGRHSWYPDADTGSQKHGVGRPSPEKGTPAHGQRGLPWRGPRAASGRSYWRVSGPLEG